MTSPRTANRDTAELPLSSSAQRNHGRATITTGSAKGSAVPLSVALLSVALLSVAPAPTWAATAPARHARLAATADPRDDQVRVDRALARTRAALETASTRVERAAQQFASANRLLPAVRTRLAEATGVVSAAQVRVASRQRAARAATVELTNATDAYAHAAAQVDQSSADVGRFAAEAYMGRDLVKVDTMLRAEGPADVIGGLVFVNDVAQQQGRLLADLTQARDARHERQEVVASRTRLADEAKAEADRALAAAQRARSDAARAQEELTALVAQRAQAVRVASQERSSTLARYQLLRAESARIAAELRALARGGGAVVPAGMRMPMPVNGWKSSDFGMRFDPFYRVWQLHAGVDLAAPGGAPIRVVTAGRVFRAGWNGGYGNYTCVYHGRYRGKSLGTCYAHQSSILVHTGQWVTSGQIIGRVGTTGASTGNHLHFEVRLDGTPVNPLGWLVRCLC